MRLYSSAISGNCYKIRLLLAHLERPYELIEVDVTSAEPRPKELLERHRLGKVPLLIFDDGSSLSESDAILWHLARDTPYLPAEPAKQTEVLRWMFFEQNGHEPTVAVNRFLITYAKKKEELAQVVAFNHRRAVAALDAMEHHLAREPFFVGERYSIADIALYGYTHVAHEADLEMEPYPAIRAWMDRVREQPGHIPMIESSAL